MKRIRFKKPKENQYMGFYFLLTEGYINAKIKEEYIIPDKAINLLKKENVDFEVLK